MINDTYENEKNFIELLLFISFSAKNKRGTKPKKIKKMNPSIGQEILNRNPESIASK